MQNARMILNTGKVEPRPSSQVFMQPCRMLEDHKIILNIDGLDLNIIKIKPPMVMTKEDCTFFLQALDSCLAIATTPRKN